MVPPCPFIRRLSPAAPVTPTAPLIVFDGVCVLCSGFVVWVIERDDARRFRFTSAQGELGQALCRDLGLDPVAFETMLLVVDGVAYGKLRAVIEIVTRLGGIWRAAGLLRAIPAGLGDWAYDQVARRRYAMFGRREACWLPTADAADRVI